MKLTLEQAKEMMDKISGSLDLLGTQITALPDNLTVGGSLDLSETPVKDKAASAKTVKHLHNGDYVAGKYLYADNILTHIRGKKKVNGYELYIGKIKGHNVVSDGKYYAHCNKLADGIADIAYKRAAEAGTDQYKHVTLDDSFTAEEMVTMYRVITGACRQGSQDFVDSLGDTLKECYTVREAIELTKGQFGSEHFADYFRK